MSEVKLTPVDIEEIRKAIREELAKELSNPYRSRESLSPHEKFMADHFGWVYKKR